MAVMGEPVEQGRGHLGIAERFMMLFSSNVSYIVLAPSAPLTSSQTKKHATLTSQERLRRL
jgi:hypothetical protein